jgi:hypothetical protein
MPIVKSPLLQACRLCALLNQLPVALVRPVDAGLTVFDTKAVGYSRSCGYGDRRSNKGYGYSNSVPLKRRNLTAGASGKPRKDFDDAKLRSTFSRFCTARNKSGSKPARLAASACRTSYS